MNSDVSDLFICSYQFITWQSCHFEGKMLGKQFMLNYLLTNETKSHNCMLQTTFQRLQATFQSYQDSKVIFDYTVHKHVISIKPTLKETYNSTEYKH